MACWETVKADLHQHGVDIKLIFGKKNSEYFLLSVKVNLILNL